LWLTIVSLPDENLQNSSFACSAIFEDHKKVSLFRHHGFKKFVKQLILHVLSFLHLVVKYRIILESPQMLAYSLTKLILRNNQTFIHFFSKNHPVSIFIDLYSKFKSRRKLSYKNLRDGESQITVTTVLTSFLIN